MQIQTFPDRAAFTALAEHHNVIPVCREILADTETPVSLLGKFQSQPGPLFLLESVEGGERWGRYSFLGTSARLQVRVLRDELEIRQNGDRRREPHHGDPLAALRALMDGFRPAVMPELPRFWGGLVGYLTFEMVSFFEPVANLLPADRPLAHFMLPEDLIIFDNLRNTLTAVAVALPDGPGDAAAAYEDAHRRLAAMLATIAKPLPPSASPCEGAVTLVSPVNEADFRRMVSRIKEYIHAGDTIQTVISQPFCGRAPCDAWTLYRAQRYVNPSPYMFFLRLDDLTLVGSSPETMVRLEGGVAALRPIAGTRPRGATDREDRLLADELLSDEKERAEHVMLVDLGRNDLGRVALTGTVQVTDLMVVERYSHVMHLVSNITCDLKEGRDAWDLIRATFPAGTLSGAPKVRAMQIITELEKQPRGPYGGAMGYIGFGGNMDLAITIRTAVLQAGTITVQAGAGIVADSDPETERCETVHKARALQRALELVCSAQEAAI